LSGVGNPIVEDTIEKCRKGFFAVVAFSLCVNLLMLTAPIYMLQLFDRVLSSRSLDTLTFLFLIAIFALLFMSALDVIRGFILLRMGSWLEKHLNGEVLTASITSTLQKGDEPTTRGLQDLTTIRSFLSNPSVFPILDAPWAPLFLGVMFLLHPLMGWLSLGGAIILFTLGIFNEIISRRLLANASGAFNEVQQKAESAVRNADVIEAMGMLPNLIENWRGRHESAMNFQTRASERTIGITAISKFVRLCLQVGLLSLGALLVLQNEMSPGAMIAGSILMARALSPVEQAIGTWKAVVSARAAYERLKSNLNEMPARDPLMKLPAPTGRLESEDASFVYPGAEEPTLKGINFKLAAGASLGIMGPMASGKTTLSRLLIGNLKPHLGHIRLDGMDVAEWNPNDLGPYIGYLPQNVELFNGTVQENISRMGPGDPEKVVEAAKLAGIHEMILRLPQGYDTEIGNSGSTLSGGQRQLIALARAVFGTPKLAILDEPNASLDGEGDKALARAIIQLKKLGSTVVVIAQRWQILHSVDYIMTRIQVASATGGSMPKNT
jgi:PrtD family type I secretion system ABC transporter